MGHSLSLASTLDDLVLCTLVLLEIVPTAAEACALSALLVYAMQACGHTRFVNLNSTNGRGFSLERAGPHPVQFERCRTVDALGPHWHWHHVWVEK